uniref:Uncharacterized protein n=4 Tax=Clytia hemisphaerica TaxID=252671 RepID=A0A7M5U599_9CNID
QLNYESATAQKKPRGQEEKVANQNNAFVLAEDTQMSEATQDSPVMRLPSPIINRTSSTANSKVVVANTLVEEDSQETQSLHEDDEEIPLTDDETMADRPIKNYSLSELTDEDKFKTSKVFLRHLKVFTMNKLTLQNTAKRVGYTSMNPIKSTVREMAVELAKFIITNNFVAVIDIPVDDKDNVVIYRDGK